VGGVRTLMINTTRISRRDLYKQVWAEPIVTLAKRYGISDVWFAKICKRNNIPRPGRGFWAQRNSGKNIRNTPLPQSEKDWTIAITGFTHVIRNTEKRKSPFTIDTPLKRYLKGISVPEVQTDPHPLIGESSKLLKSCETDVSGLIMPNLGKCLDIRVSHACLPRALRFMDTLVKTLTEIDVKIALSEKSTNVEIKGVLLGIALYELTVRRRLKARDLNLDGYYHLGYDEYDKRLFPSGVLCLEMSNMGKYSYRISQKKWKDTETIRLEDCFYGFISGLFKAAAVKKSGMPEEGKGDEEMTDQDME
jgi:hypothetical protein